MRRLLISGAVALGSIVGMACDPVTPPPPPPVLIPPALCGQTVDGKAVVTTYTDSPRCPAPAGVKRIVASIPCGPILQGSDAMGDCWRGFLAQVPGRALYGWHIVPRSSFNQAGDVAQSWVASDYTAA
jgi:hypothetical protein